MFTRSNPSNAPQIQNVGPVTGSVDDPFDVTVASTITAGSIHTITITGMTASVTVSQSILKVKTTSEPSESSIMII